MPTGLPIRQSPGGRGARARVLQAARVLFTQQGINATGVAELAEAAQVSKRTLYHHFPSKDEVVLAYLREYERDPSLGPEGVLERDDLHPRAQLLELLAAAGEGRGCPFLNAAVELPDPDHPVHRMVVRHKQRFAARLGEVARAAGARHPEQLGRRLAVLYDGACAQAVIGGGLDGAAATHAIAAALVRDALDR
jgi:AcrR family transcriptional regulator